MFTYTCSETCIHSGVREFIATSPKSYLLFTYPKRHRNSWPKDTTKSFTPNSTNPRRQLRLPSQVLLTVPPCHSPVSGTPKQHRSFRTSRKGTDTVQGSGGIAHQQGDLIKLIVGLHHLTHAAPAPGTSAEPIEAPQWSPPRTLNPKVNTALAPPPRQRPTSRHPRGSWRRDLSPATAPRALSPAARPALRWPGLRSLGPPSSDG